MTSLKLMVAKSLSKFGNMALIQDKIVAIDGITFPEYRTEGVAFLSQTKDRGLLSRDKQ